MTSFLKAAVIVLFVSTSACGKAPGPADPSVPPVTLSPDAPPPPKEPTADDFPYPEARLSIRVNGAPVPAILGLDSVQFDASQSIGEGLTYRVQYWDGTTSDAQRSERVVMTPGILGVRLTVTDRFGRSDKDDDEFAVEYFTNQFDFYGYYWPCSAPSVGTVLILWFDREAPQVSGNSWRGPFTGTVNGDRTMRLDFSDGTAVIGKVIDDYTGPGLRHDFQLNVTEQGGVTSGRSLYCYFHVS